MWKFKLNIYIWLCIFVSSLHALHIYTHTHVITNTCNKNKLIDLKYLIPTAALFPRCCSFKMIFITQNLSCITFLISTCLCFHKSFGAIEEDKLTFLKTIAMDNDRSTTLLPHSWFSFMHYWMRWNESEIFCKKLSTLLKVQFYQMHTVI